MPDIDNGQPGTGIVNVIELQLDVNHDGNMDLSFSGPDSTSPTRPYVFWVNNDFDRLAYDADDKTNYEMTAETRGTFNLLTNSFKTVKPLWRETEELTNEAVTPGVTTPGPGDRVSEQSRP